MKKDKTCVLEISNVGPISPCTYTCRATNVVGEAVTAASVTVQESGKPPKFTEPLQPVTAVEGSKLTLRCVVTGSPVLDIKWYREGRELRPTRDFKPSYDLQTGEATLSIPEVFPDDQGTFTCTAINKYGKDATSTMLTVKEDIVVIEKSDLYEPPKFVKPLLPMCAPEGEPLEMVVEATGTPVPTLQWFHNNQELKPSRDFKVTTEGGKSSLLITEVFPDDAGVYGVKASNKAGQASTTATLKVISEVESPKPEPMPPIFTKPLLSQLVPEGEPVRMEVEVLACPDATFTWTFKKKPIKSSRDFQITSENNKSVLMICEAFADDSGAYTCKAQNEAGTATTTATLTIESPPEEEVTEAPKFTTPLSPIKVMDGEEAKLSCVVTGEPTPKVTWLHNNREVRENSEVWTTCRKDGYCELFLSEVFPEDMGEYICKAVNKAGEAVTRTTLTVESYEYVQDSEIATLSMDKTTSAEATLISLSEESSSEEFTVAIPDLPEEEVAPETPTKKAEFVMVPKSEPGTSPKFIEPLQSSIETKPGQTVKIQCRVTGTPKPKITWFKSGKVLKHSPDYHIYYEPSGVCTLTIIKIKPEDTTEFSCEARNRNGVDITSTKITVAEYTPRKPDWVLELESQKKAEEEKPQSPRFESPLRDVFVKTVGKKVTLECIVKGVPRPQVTWYHNEKAIDITSGYFVVSHLEDRTLLIILNVTKEIEGKFTCRAVNEHGEETTTAYLYVGVTREEHEARQKALKETEKKPKKSALKKATEETTFMQRTREFKETKSVLEQAETSLSTQTTHVQVQQIMPQEQPSEVVPSTMPAPEKAEVEFVVSSQHTLSISEVQTEEKVKEFKPSEIPGSKKLDIIFPSEVATEVSEVLTQGSLKELKSGELPGTEKAEVSIPFELAMQVLEVLENSSISDMKPDEIPGSKMADVSIPSELATQVFEVLASSSIGDLSVSELPGSKKADMEIAPDIATEVSEVITHNTVQELKPGELPGSREAVFSVPSDVAMQVSEVTTQGSLLEMAEEIPNSATAQVTLPSELATQVLEILSTSSVAALSAENLPGSRKVDVILPSEVAMQVYETLIHSSLTDMKTEEKPSSLTASVGVVEKVSLQVSQVTFDQGLSDMTIEHPTERKAIESARPELPTAQSEAVQVLEEPSKPIEDVHEEITLEKKPSVEEAETVEHTVTRIKKKPKEEPTVTEETKTEAIVKIKKKSKEEKPAEVVVERKPSIKEEEKPEEVTEKAVLKIKKKPAEEEEKPVEAVIETQLAEEIKIEEVSEKAVVKIKKRETEELETIEAVIERKPKEEKPKKETHEEHAVLKIKKKPKEKPSEKEKPTEEKLPEEVAESAVITIKKKPEEEKPVEAVVERKISVEEVKKVEIEEKAVIKIQRKASVKEEITETDVLKPEEKPEKEKTTKITLKKKPVVKEEMSSVEEFKIPLKPETVEENVFEDTEETFSLNIQKPKEPKIIEEEHVETIVIKSEEIKYTIEEATADLKIKKQIIIDEPVPSRAEIEEIPEVEEKVKIKRKPKKEETVTEEVKIVKKPEEITKTDDVVEEFKVELPTKPVVKEAVEETTVKVVTTEMKQTEIKVEEQKAELTVKKFVEEEPEKPKFAEIKQEVPKEKSPEKEKPKVEEKPVEEKVKLKRKPKVKEEPVSDSVQIPLKPIEKEPEKQEEVEETFKVELPKKPEQKEVKVEEATVKLTVQDIKEDKHVVEEKAEITVKKVVEEPKEEEVVKTVKMKKKPKKPEEQPEEVVEFKIPEKPKEEEKPEEVEEVFQLKIKPKEEEKVQVEEETAELVVLKPDKPQQYTVTEEKAEVVIKKKVEVEEVDEKVVFKKKKTPKVKDTPDTEVKITLEEKKPIEPECVEEVEEAFTIRPKKKEEKPTFTEEVEEVLKLPQVIEKKDYSVTEETAEITVKKKVVEEDVGEVKITQKKKKPKVKEEEPAEFKITLDEKKPEKEPEEKPEDVEETFAVKIPKKEPVKEITETVEDVVKIEAPKPIKVVEEEAAEITIKKEVPVEKLPEEEKSETTVIKRKKKVPERKKSESPVEETFAVPLKEKREPSPEESSVEEKFTVGLKKPEKKVVEEAAEETVKVTVEEKKVTEYKKEEVAAEITVKKVVEKDEVKEPIKKEEAEVTKKLKLKKKVETKPEEKPVEETFAIPIKKEEPVKEESPVQEAFSVKLKEKVTAKEEKTVEESFKLVIEQEKPKPKEEVAAEEATVVLKPKEEPKRKPSIKEEVEEKATLKLKPKKKEPEKKPEEPQETFRIPKKPEEEKPKPTEEKPVEEAFKVTIPKKQKVIEEAEEEAKIVIPAVKDKEYKVTDVSEEVTIKKVVEEKEETISLKKRTDIKKKETVSEEFKITRKREEVTEEVEEPEPAEFKVDLKKPKPKPKEIVEEEDSLKLKIPEKKKPEVTEENVAITVKKKVPVDEKIVEEEQKISIKKPKKKVEIEEENIKESFTVSRKKSIEEKETVEDVEESFQIKTKPKKKPQVVSEDEESLSISLPSEKPEYKTEDVSEETSVTLRKEAQEEEIIEILETTEYVAISSFVSEKTDSVTLVEGERVLVIEKTSQDWWFVRKVVTNEKGFVPPSVLQDSATYTHYMKDTLSKKIEKLPVLRKPKPGEKMTAPKFVKKLTPMKVTDGQTAEISCQVTGNPRPTITWFKQTQIIKPSMEFQIFYDEDNVTTLIIREVFPEDAGTYTVVAKNAAGFASCSADLLVDTPFSDHGSETFPSSRLSLSRQSSLADILEGIPPVFAEKPKDKKVDEGKPVELVCKVTGIPEPKITWLRNQKPLKESDRIEITTVTEDLDITKVIVTIKKAKVEDAGTYEIIAENREGKSVTSLILNVTEKPKKPKEEPPIFSQTYSDVICSEKDTVSLTVKVQGTPPPEVTWYKNGKELKPSKNVTQSVNKDVHILTVSDTKEGDTGDYRCVAKNPKGTVEHTAKVTVQKTGVDFVEKLYDVEVKERESALFVIEVSHPTAKVTWHKDGEQLKPNDRIKFVEDDCTRKLIIEDANVNDEGEYTCVLGEKECTAELVVVELPPDFKGEMKDVTVAKEQSASFQVELTKGDARARWFKNGKEIDFSEHVMLKIDGKRQKLIIYNATFEDAGTYTCVVGNKKRTADLKVEAPTVEFTAKLPDKMTVPQDTDVSFTVQLSRPDVPVQWLKNGQPVPEKEKDKFQFIKEKNVYKMIVRRAQKDDAAEYSCVAGNVKTTTKLQVQEAHAEFTLKLRDVIVRESDTATLLVEVTRETFEVRWMKDGQTLKPTDRFVMEKEGCRRRLIIKETMLEDRGMYTCVLDEKICSSTLTVESTPRVVSEKRHFKVKKGGNVVVDVEFLALPQPKIEWLCKGKTVSPDKKRTVENYGNKTVLTIKKVEDADVGNYTLKLSNKCGECKTDFTVSIIDKPKPPGMPNASEIGDTSLTLSWKVPDSDGGSPITNYLIEYHDRNTLRWSTYNEKFTIDQPFSKVDNLKKGEEYMFRVIAVNEVGKSDPSPGTKYILIQEPKAGEPPAIVEHLKPVTCGIKKSTSMTCRISGQPPPTIKWLKNGKDLLVAKNITTTYENQIATMKITETTEKSAGTYTCKATNPLGTVETSSELKIQEPPTIQYDESMKNVRLKSYSEYVLDIKVFGYPSPELVWFKNGKVLESTKHTLVQVKEDSTTITIRSVENTDSATYTLQLTNSAGTVKYDFRLFVLDKPLPPEGPIAFHKIEKNSVTIGWQPPSIGGSEVLSYIIEKCETRRKVWIEVATVKSDVLTQEITELSEGIEYAFRVIATNEYGRSDPLTSDPVAPKSLFDKPHAPKGPFTTSNMTENSFTLSWLAPDNDGGSPIIEYIVERKEATRKAWQRVATTDGKSLSMEVTGLKKDTAYHFRVCCRNEIGHSPYFAPEETITPGLKISPPSSPVGPLAILNMTNKTITLSWKPPTNTGGAELTAYIIEKRESTKKAWNRLETLEPHVTTYTVHNLTHTKEYFFRVFAENPAGLSPPLETEAAIKLTSTAVRPSPPTGPLEVVVTGPSSIVLAWGRPESDGGSPILGYTVAMKNVRRIMWMEVGQVDGETQRLQVKDLQEGSEYMVRIMARNEVGISDPLEPEDPVKVIRPAGYKESEKPEVDEKTISVSYSTETSSSWIREANVEPLLRSYTKHVLAGRNEYFFRIWHLAESMFK